MAKLMLDTDLPQEEISDGWTVVSISPELEKKQIIEKVRKLVNEDLLCQAYVEKWLSEIDLWELWNGESTREWLFDPWFVKKLSEILNEK